MEKEEIFKKTNKKKITNSFKYAFCGIITGIKNEKNTYFDYDFGNNCRNNIKNNTFRMDYMYYFIWNCYVCRTSKFGYRNCSRYDNSI